MKARSYNFFLGGLLWLLPLFSYGQEARKTLQKTFSVSPQTLLKIAHKFGKIDVHTDEKNQVRVDIEFIAKARTQQKAQEILNELEVVITQSAELVSLETQINSKNISADWQAWDNSKRHFEINYVVHMPANQPLDLSNKYGNIYLANFAGKLDLSSKYGALKVENVTGNTLKNIEIKYGNGSIRQLEKGNLSIGYSNISLGKLGEVELSNNYSNSQIEEAQKLVLENKYGNLDVGILGEVTGEISYSNFVVKNLKNYMDMIAKYMSTFKIQQVEPSCKAITLDAKYSDCFFNFSQGSGGQFEVDLKYGNFSCDGGSVYFNQKIVEGTNAFYQGKLGDTNAKIKISLKYGSLTFK